MTKDELLNAIRRFHADTSRRKSETYDGLDEAGELVVELLNILGDELDAESTPPLNFDED